MALFWLGSMSKTIRPLATSLTDDVPKFVPAGWMLNLAELMGNALTETALLTWLLHCVSLLTGSDVEYAPVFSHTAGQNHQTNCVFAELASLETRVEGVLTQLRNEKETHVHVSLTHWHEAQTEMAARMAVKRLEAARDLLDNTDP